MTLRVVRTTGLLLALAATPATAADVEVRAMTLNRYAPSEVTLGPGDRLVFANADPFSQHNLTATSVDETGTPLFASPTLRSGSAAAVADTSGLAPGAYGFFCTIHPVSMRGRLAIAPGGADAQPPVLSVAFLPRSLTRIRGTQRLPVAVVADEAGRATVRARAKGQTIAQGEIELRAGATRAALELTQAGRRLLRRHARLAVTVTVRGTDRAGNPATATVTRTLR